MGGASGGCAVARMLAAAIGGLQLVATLGLADVPAAAALDTLDSSTGSGTPVQSPNSPTPAPPPEPASADSAMGLQPAALLRGRPARPRFLHITSAITIDGRLDEQAWSVAAPTARFFEIYPGNVAAPKVRTEARFLYDESYVYVGIRADDSQPGKLRSHFTRRDQLTTDQDYVEVMIDPQNSQRTAMFFRVNPSGSETDGQFSEDSGTRDYAPDFDFDVRTSIDATGWSAEFRIPLSTLRYTAGANQSWTVVVYRNLPREISSTIASAPVPRGSNRVLWYADRTPGISIDRLASGLTVTPHITYTHRDTSNQMQAGVDAKWQARPDTVVDFTVAPDFSQVEADALQLTANTRFALAVLEKRPFFLESADLLSTPLAAIFTRSFSDPDVGARITHRSADSEYTALLLRDAGGGTVIEPGPTSSSSAPQDFVSTAFVGRYRFLQPTVAWGALGSVRQNDDGSENAVLGVDANWAPTASDRITGQLLWSRTRTPDRPGLLSTWDGRTLEGAAGYFGWRHSSDAWYSSITYRTLSHDFRSWNGFLTRVGASSASFSGGLYFYPKSSLVTRVSPLLTASSISEAGGSTISRSLSPGISFQFPRDTYVTISWSPAYQDTTAVGLRSADTWSATITATPVDWLPNATLTFSGGDALDYSTGTVGRGRTVQAVIPFRLNRLELDATVAYQSLDGDGATSGARRLFTERNFQLDAIWHFSSRLYAQVLYQNARLSAADPEGRDPLRTVSDLSSFLISYQANWQTRYFLGVREGSQGREVFGKISYALSR